MWLSAVALRRSSAASLVVPPDGFGGLVPPFRGPSIVAACDLSTYAIGPVQFALRPNTVL